MAGDVLDIIGNLVVPLFLRSETGGFSIYHESSKCNTSRLLTLPRAFPAPIGNRKEQHIQPIRISKAVKNRRII
jgi:hypothetical protein